MAENLITTRRALLSGIAVFPFAVLPALAGVSGGISGQLAAAINAHERAAILFADNCTYADCVSPAYDAAREAMHGNLQHDLEKRWLDLLRTPMASLDDMRAKGAHMARHWADMDGMAEAPAALFASMMGAVQ